MKGFYTTTMLSPNMAETPEGYLVAKNVVIGESNIHLQYTPQELGVHSDAPIIQVWRDPAEVFKPSTMASFEGKDVTQNHPNQFLSPDNLSPSRGVVSFVRRGSNGDADKLLADLMIKDATLISLVKSGMRDVSCGYQYQLRCRKCGNIPQECDCKEPDFTQTEISGNHVAIVSAGRSPEAKIVDSAEALRASCVCCQSGECMEHSPVIRQEVTKSIGDTEGKVAETQKTIQQRNERPMPIKPKNWFLHTLGLGLKEVAKDSEPEDFAQAMEAVSKQTSAPSATDSDPGAVERNFQYAESAHDVARRRFLSGNDAPKKGTDKKVKDDETKDHPRGCMCDSCQDEGKQLRDTLGDIKEFMAEHRKAKAASASNPDDAKKATGDANGASGEDPNEMKSWKSGVDAHMSGVDAHMSEMRDKMATLHEGLGQLLRSKDAVSEPPEVKEGPEEKMESETAKDRRARDKRARDADAEEMGEIPESESMDAHEGDEGEEESDVPPTQHETTPAAEAGEEEWEADHPKESEDDTAEVEKALAPGEIPQNPLPEAKDSRARRGLDTRETLLKEHLKRREFVANPNNYRSTKAWDAEREAWNKQFRILNGKTVSRASDRSYGDLNKPKRDDQKLQAIDEHRGQSQDAIAQSFKDQTKAYGDWMRDPKNVPNPTKAKSA